jgi:Uma2 family endonuclease
VRIRTHEYDRMTDIGLFDGRRVELVEGTLYEMPPMRTPHLLVLVRLQRMQVPLQVPDFDEPEPDLAILRVPLGRRKPAAVDCVLAIEVSDSTLPFDRERKVPAYRRGGVPEVWLVNLPERQLEVTSEQGSRVHRPGGTSVPSVEGVPIDLASLFVDLERDELGLEP